MLTKRKCIYSEIMFDHLYICLMYILLCFMIVIGMEVLNKNSNNLISREILQSEATTKSLNLNYFYFCFVNHVEGVFFTLVYYINFIYILPVLLLFWLRAIRFFYWCLYNWAKMEIERYQLLSGVYNSDLTELTMCYSMKKRDVVLHFISVCNWNCLNGKTTTNFAGEAQGEKEKRKNYTQ